MEDILKYVSSFIDGRVRIRHPALKIPAMVDKIKEKLAQIPATKTYEFNVRTGSLLLTYDQNLISRNELIKQGTEWAEILNAAIQKNTKNW